MATPTPIRSGTKATGRVVFPVCKRLRDEIGDFRNEDVLAITGGGMGTVSRLVKMYKLHEKIIDANKALDAEATISLVHTLDQLLESQLQRSQQAIDDFIGAAGEEIAELSELLEQENTRGNALKDSNDSFQKRIAELENEKMRLEATLEEKKRELAEKDSSLAMKNNELQHTHKEHASKLEQLNSQHQHQLAQSLENQRQALSQEHTDTLTKISNEFESQLQAIQKDNRKTQAALNQRLDETTHELQNTRTTLHEEQQAHTLLQQKIPRLEKDLMDKQQQLTELQEVHKTIINKTETARQDRSLELSKELSQVADTMSMTVNSVTGIIEELQTFLEKTKKEIKSKGK